MNSDCVDKDAWVEVPSENGSDTWGFHFYELIGLSETNEMGCVVKLTTGWSRQTKLSGHDVMRAVIAVAYTCGLVRGDLRATIRCITGIES